MPSSARRAVCSRPAHRSSRRVSFGGALAAAAVLAVGQPRRVAAQQPAAQLSPVAASQLCEHTMDGTRFPEAAARMREMSAGRDAPAAFARGCLFMNDGQYDRAADQFENAVAGDDGNAAYHFQLGQAYGARAQHANPFKQALLVRKVKREFDRAVQLDPGLLDARVGLVTFYLLAPGMLGGSADKARAEAGEMRRRNPYRGGIAFAQIARHEKDDAGAVRELDALTRQYPDSVWPYVALATGYEERKMWPDAWAAVERLGRARPDAPVVDYAVGRLAAESGQQLDRGAAALARYVRTTPQAGDPPLATAHLRLGTIYEQQGKKEAAHAEFDTAAKLDPKLAGAREGLDRTR